MLALKCVHYGKPGVVVDQHGCRAEYVFILPFDIYVHECLVIQRKEIETGMIKFCTEPAKYLQRARFKLLTAALLVIY